ncbi:MAG: hypothetical protein Q9170_002934 [Blastenia crenularia]
MSRSDYYLSLCLEQAALSSLHYRHGCIIVRGGKVIGKGYNEYRPGFNSGVQSTGRLSSASAIDKPGHSKSKSKPKKKPSKTSTAISSRASDIGTLAPPSGWKNRASKYRVVLNDIPACSSSKHTPTPSVEQLRSKLPRRSAVAGLPFNSLVLKPLHLNSLQFYQEDYYKEEEEKEKERNEMKRQNTGNNNVHHHAQLSHLEFQKANSQKVQQLTSDDNEKQRKLYLYGLPEGNQYRHHSPHEKGQDLPLRHPQQQRRQQHRNSTATVMPQNRIMTKSHHTAERMKDPRLNGADLYVARLGRTGTADHFGCGCQRDNTISSDEVTVIDTKLDQHSTDSSTSRTQRPLTGSLHDELLFPSPKEDNRPKPKTVPKGEHVFATHSRPCYRCISYMHSAGIKRVFWTNKKGEWECGKVRDLVDALECPVSPESNGLAGVSKAGSVYVTKSEVLLLKGLI